jgi:hypothetical protein
VTFRGYAEMTSISFAVVTANGNPTKRHALLLGVVINQSIADFAIERHRRAGTHFSKPSFADLIGKPSKAKYRDVNGPSFSRQRLDEITSATGTVILAKWFIGLDLYLSGLLTRPTMAVPSVAVHGGVLLVSADRCLHFSRPLRAHQFGERVASDKIKHF